MPRYNYTPLHNSANPIKEGADLTIRLIEVLGSVKNTRWHPPLLRLRTVSLADEPVYDALSYVWGPSNSKLEARITEEEQVNPDKWSADETILPVTDNLHDALKMVQAWKDAARITKNAKHEPSQFLWVDAICINQDDLQEKSHQVQNMRHIYQRARRTVVWLGTGDERPTLEFKLQTVEEVAEKEDQKEEATEKKKRFANSLAKLGESVKKYMESIEDALNYIKADGLSGPELTQICVERLSQPEFDDLLGLNDLDEEKMTAGLFWRQRLATIQHAVHQEALRKMMKNRWFSRSWIIQEVTVAREVIVIYACSIMKWEDLVRATKLVREFHAKELFLTELDKARELDDIKSLWNRAEGVSLQELVISLGYREATLIRDYIYSLLGLVNDDLGIRPTYEDDVSDEEIFVDLVTRIIKHHNSLDILAKACLYKGHLLHTKKDSFQIPTWVPDWRFFTDTKSLLKRHRQLRYTAGGPTDNPWFRFENGDGSSEVRKRTLQHLRLRGATYKLYKISEYWPMRNYAVLSSKSRNSKETSLKEYEPTDEKEDEDKLTNDKENEAILGESVEDLRFSTVYEDGEARDYEIKFPDLTIAFDFMQHAPQGLNPGSGFLSKIRAPKVAPENTYPLTGESLDDALWQTLVCGVPPERYKRTKAAWLRHARFLAFRNQAAKAEKSGDKWKKIGYQFKGAGAAMADGITKPSDLVQWDNSVILALEYLSMETHMQGRRLAWLACGALGLFPIETRIDDLVILAEGCAFPLVIREVAVQSCNDEGEACAEKRKLFHLVGPAYIHGFMHGEEWKRRKTEDIEEITLV